MKLPSCLLVLLGLAAGHPSSARAQDSAVTDAQAVIAAARIPWSRWPDFSRHVDDVARLYRARAGAPVWLDAGAPARQAGEAMAQLAAASAHGLDPGDYDAAVLDSLARTLRGAPGGAAAMRFDLLLSVAFVRFIADLHVGRVPHAPLSRTLPDRPLDLTAAVSAAVAGDSVSRLADAVAPFTLEHTARAAGVEESALLQLVEAVRRARCATVVTGTGVTMSAAGNVTQWLAWVVMILTGAMNRYPSARSVSMNLGEGARSPRASRIFRIATFRPSTPASWRVAATVSSSAARAARASPPSLSAA